MRRSDSIADMMPEALRQSRYHMKRCFQRFVSQGSRLMKQQHLLEELHGGGSADNNKQLAADGFLGHVISCTHEAVVLPPYVALAVRRNPGVWEYITVHSGDLTVQQITPSDYLKRKEILFLYDNSSQLEVNLGALDLSTPRLTLPCSIGNGMHLVSRFLSSRLGGGGGRTKNKALLDYLLALRYYRRRPGDQQQINNKLLISDTLDTVGKLQAALLLAQAFVSEQHPDTPYQQMAHRFQEWGLEKGWGDTAEACGHTLACLAEVLQAPDPASIHRFFSRVPSVFDVVIFSVHGYFGQHKVLGMPDTGGQVVYILDQVRALEEELLQRIKGQGLTFTPNILVVIICICIVRLINTPYPVTMHVDQCPLLMQLTRLIPEAKGTTCNVELEPIENTRHSSILRVPFKTQDGQDLPHWVSRFDIYPYLERYAQVSIHLFLGLYAIVLY